MHQRVDRNLSHLKTKRQSQTALESCRIMQAPFAGAWAEAHAQREELMGRIIKWSGVGTLEDFRRFRDYDADKTVDRYLNKPAVKASMSSAKPS